MGKPIKVIRVKSASGLPDYNKHSPDYWKGVRGKAYPETRTLYVIGKTDPDTIEHEKYHIIKRHPEKERNPSDYVKHEMEAMVHAYRKTGYPKHIVTKLNAMYNDLHWREYWVSKSDTLRIIDRNMSMLDVPELWKSDWSKVKDSARNSKG
jgi:hypothetical protein